MSPVAETCDDSPTSRSFFDRLCAPFFSAFRVLGICPYTRNRNGVFQKRIASRSTAYTLCSGVAFGYITISTIGELVLQPPPAAVSNFNKMLMAFGWGVFFAPSLIVPVLMWFETNKIQTYLQEWQVFQDDYDRVIGKLDDTTETEIEKRVNRTFQSILVFLAIAGIAISWISIPYNLTFIVCTMKSISTMAFITGFWYVSTIVMATINENYKNKLQTDLAVHAHAIEDLRLLWARMSKLVHESGNYMSGTITFCIFQTTVAVVLTVYALTVWGVTLAKTDRYEALASVAAAFVCSGVSLYIYCDCGHSRTRNVVDNVIFLILKMKSTMTWRNSNYIQITLFLNTLNQYQSNVDVAGFYEINRGLFGSILSLLVTYLIVLMQLNSSFTSTPTTEQNNMTTVPNLHNLSMQH